MKKVFLLGAFLLLVACAKHQAPLIWPCTDSSLNFSGVLHSPQGDIPVQGALKDAREKIRYAVIMQNGILLGSGFIEKAGRSVVPAYSSPTARLAVKQIGKALALFLDGYADQGEKGGDFPWKKVDKRFRFQDKQLTLTINMQDSLCPTLK